MTVSYTLQVATCTGVGCFWRLLFRWRGSTWKLLWPNLLAFIILVIGVSILHRIVLTEEQKVDFQKIARKCKRDKDMIPMAFILGFYVNLVITRWWSQYVKMPWPDGMALYISTLIYGQDDRGRLIRRTLIRYCNLALVMTLRLFSTRILRRFPTYDHLVSAGLLLANEKVIIEHVDHMTPHPKYWMPLVWAGGIMLRARKEGRVKDDYSLKTLIDALNNFRGECGGMIDYDWISIPLVYTQVVTLAVYTFIVTAVVGSQAHRSHSHNIFDVYLPVFSFMQLFFYMGWLKVAESLVNPWGDDDDDFEVNWMVDRHMQVSYMIVDEMHQDHPEMLKDQYWDDIFPTELPYTQASRQFNCRPSSTFNLGMDDLISRHHRYQSEDIIEEDLGDMSDSDEEVMVEVDADVDDDADGNDNQGGGTSGRGSLRPGKKPSVNVIRKGYRPRSKNSSVGMRPRLTGSRMLYEAQTTSYSSLTALFPPTENDMFSLSDVSVINEEEMAALKEEQNKTRKRSLVEPHPAAFTQDLATDLKPVDLSAPDSETDNLVQDGRDGWWRPSTEVATLDPTESTQTNKNQKKSPVSYYSPKAQVMTPTSEPVPQPFNEHALDPPSNTASELNHQLNTDSTHSTTMGFDVDEPRHVTFSFTTDPGAGLNVAEEMVQFVPPNMWSDNVRRSVNLDVTPTSSASTTPTSFESTTPTTFESTTPTSFGSTSPTSFGSTTPTSFASTTSATTTIVTTSPPRDTTITTTSSPGRRSVLSTRIVDIIYGIVGHSSITTLLTETETARQPRREEVAITMSDEPVDRLPSPYVPTPAIPVPGVSLAHMPSTDEPVSNEELAMMEAAKAARRGFQELEPISEQTETSAGNTPNTPDETRKPPDSNADEGGPSTSAS